MFVGSPKLYGEWLNSLERKRDSAAHRNETYSLLGGGGNTTKSAPPLMRKGGGNRNKTTNK